MGYDYILTTTHGKRSRRVLLTLTPLILGLALAIIAVGALLALPAPELQAQGPEDDDISGQDVMTAYVVVRFSDTDVIGRRITFTEGISGYRALQLAGLDPLLSPGGLLCKIDGFGTEIEGDWCEYFGSFWVAYHLDNGSWVPNTVGVTDVTITQTGHVEGFSWGDDFSDEPPPAAPITAAADGLAWLATQQSVDDGGYGTANDSVESLFAVAANGYAASEWQREPDSPSLGGHVLSNGATFANSTAAASGKLAVGLVAGDSCWPRNATQPMDYYQASTGAYSSTNDSGAAPHAWGMLGTIALSDTVPNDAVQYLEDLQQGNGGWEWGIGWGTDTNATALAIQALIASGEPASSGAIQDALDYLQSTQNTTDAGFPYNPDGGWPGAENSDTNSTAYAVQAIVAAGEDPTAAPWVMNNTNPISFLLSMQLGDGSFEWQPGLGASQIATQQAIPALLGRSIPLEVGALDRCWVQWLPVIFEQ